jgi:hypothetical protein
MLTPAKLVAQKAENVCLKRLCKDISDLLSCQQVLEDGLLTLTRLRGQNIL